MCMTFGYNPQIIFCHFFHSLNLVIFGFNYYRSLWTLDTQCLIAGEIKTIGGGIHVPWTLFLVVPETNLILLFTFECVHFAKFTFIIVFFREILDLAPIFYSQKSYIACSLVIHTLLAFVYYPNGNEMDQMVRNDIACNCIRIV